MLLTPYKGIMPRLGRDVFLAAGAQIAGDVEIGDESSVWFNCVLRGDVNDVKIGRRTNIQDGTVIHVATSLQGTYIGDDVTVGHMALLHACTIRDGAFIGMKACVMDGAIIESGAMVAAGSLVTKGTRVPSGELWAGSPAKLLRAVTEKEKEFIPWSASHYVKLARDYLNNEALSPLPPGERALRKWHPGFVSGWRGDFFGKCSPLFAFQTSEGPFEGCYR